MMAFKIFQKHALINNRSANTLLKLEGCLRLNLRRYKGPISSLLVTVLVLKPEYLYAGSARQYDNITNLDAQPRKIYDNNAKDWYIRFDDDRMGYTYILSITINLDG